MNIDPSAVTSSIVCERIESDSRCVRVSPISPALSRPVIVLISRWQCELVGAVVQWRGVWED